MSDQNRGTSLKRIIGNNFQKYTMIIAMLAIWLYFQVTTGGIFLTARNMNNLFLQMCYIGIASCAMVLVMVAGHIDLSVGSVIGFTGAVMAYAIRYLNMPMGFALIATLAVGVLVGMWQGYWIAFKGIPAFIVTLSSQLLFRGGVLGVTKGNTIQPNNDAFKAIGQAYLPNIGEGDFNITAILIYAICLIIYIFSMIAKRRNRIRYQFKVDSYPMFVLKLLGMAIVMGLVFLIWSTDRGIPVPVLILAAVVLIMNIISKNTAFGRHVFAIGGNIDASRLSGIDVKKTTALIFIIMGVCSAMSGIVYTSRLNSAAIAGGTGAETDIIAAAIIGGTSPAGGKGSVLGCIIGALVMASLENGMSILSMGSFEKYIVKGLVLLFAVAIDVANKKEA